MKIKPHQNTNLKKILLSEILDLLYVVVPVPIDDLKHFRRTRMKTLPENCEKVPKRNNLFKNCKATLYYRK